MIPAFLQLAFPWRRYLHSALITSLTIIIPVVLTESLQAMSTISVLILQLKKPKPRLRTSPEGILSQDWGFTVAFYHCLLCSKTICWMKEAQPHAAPGEGGVISGAAYFPQQRCMHDSSVARHDFVLLWDLLKEGLQ